MSINKEKLVQIFTDYYNTFDTSIDDITRKYHHSLRVMDYAEKVAESEGLTGDDKDLAIEIGLLHDYARFEQWTNFGTYKDRYSFDHGDRAVELLFDKGHIKNFSDIPEAHYDIIQKSIINHNKPDIIDIYDDKTMLFCKLVRDADKLDIFQLIADEPKLFIETDDEIPESFRNKFFKHEIILNENCTNENEHMILILALFFNVNFKYSYRIIKETNILWRIYERINNKDRFQEYFDYLDQYINKMAE